MAWHGFLNRQPHPTSAMLLLLSLTILSCSTILPTTALRLDEKCDESAFSSAFDNYTNLYCPEVSETASPVRISFDRPIPSYVKPLRYAVNSFAKFQIGEEHDAEQFSFYMDGYQKMTIIDFCDNDSGAAAAASVAHFSSRFINTKYYEEALASGRPVPASTFNVTTPKRRSDRLPFENFKACNAGACDQAPVVTFLLPDNQTMVSATDKSDWLNILVDADTNASGGPSTSGPVEWGDAIGAGSPAASRALRDPTTGDVIGATLDASTMPMTTAKIFRISADEPTTRSVIGSVELTSPSTSGENVYYMHSFGLSRKRAVLVEHPVGLKTATLMTAKPMLDAFQFDHNGTTKFHVMRLTDEGDGASKNGSSDNNKNNNKNKNKNKNKSDLEGEKAGSYVTYDAGHPFMNMHVGNTYEEVNRLGQELLVMDMEIYVLDDPALDSPFLRMGFDHIFDESFVPRDGNKYRRYTINLATGAVSFVDLLAPDPKDGNRPYGFLKINPAYAGVRNCFTYVTKFASNGVGGGGGGGALRQSTVKYDHCSERVDGEWNGGDTDTQLFPNELVFIRDPEGSDEDDGVLFGLVYNAKTLASEATFVDAKTMETLSVATAPFRVPWPLHGEVFPRPPSSP